MKHNPFYEKMLQLDKAKLLEVFKDYKDYQPEAVEAAVQVAKEKGFHNEIQDLYHQIKDENLNERERHRHNKNFLSKINPNNFISLSAGTVSQINFENKLLSLNIDFYKDESNDWMHPIIKYYFSDEDFGKVQAFADEARTHENGLPKTGLRKASPGISRLITYALIIIIAAIAIILLAINAL